MAAQAEEPLATAADPSPSIGPLLRRASPEDREEKKDSRETKRRRTCVAALESLETEKADSLDSFSFDARNAAPIETTPKFGSFNPVLLMETTVVEATEASSPEQVSDEPPAKEGSETDGKAEREEEGGDTSKGNNGNSESNDETE
jgi:hypothetical protein